MDSGTLLVSVLVSDFTSQINGWGLKDVQLYHKLLRANKEILRSPDPHVFHIWHKKYVTSLPHQTVKDS